VPNSLAAVESDSEEDEEEEQGTAQPAGNGATAGAPRVSAAAGGDDGQGGRAHGEFSVIKGLEELFKPEQMRGDDQYVCEKCTGKHDAERGVRLRTTPPIVTIHLKRFAIQTSQDRKGRTELNLIKVNTAVHFDTTLDFRSFLATSNALAAGSTAAKPGVPTDASHSAKAEMAEEGTAAQSGAGLVGERLVGETATGEHQPHGQGVQKEEEAEEEEEQPSSLLYDLYAVLMHSGSLEKGHYIALAKDVTDESWYRFDDEKVTRLNEEELGRELRKAYGGRGSTSAYMLFYRERPLNAAPAPAAEPLPLVGGGTAESGGAAAGGAGAQCAPPSSPTSPTSKAVATKGGNARAASSSPVLSEGGSIAHEACGAVGPATADSASPSSVELQAGHVA